MAISTSAYLGSAVRIHVDASDKKSALFKLKYNISLSDIEYIFNQNIIESLSYTDYYATTMKIKTGFRPDEVMVHEILTDESLRFKLHVPSVTSDAIPIVLVGWEFRQEPILDFCIYKFEIMGPRWSPEDIRKYL